MGNEQHQKAIDYLKLMLKELEDEPVAWSEADLEFHTTEGSTFKQRHIRLTVKAGYEPEDTNRAELQA